MKYWFINMWWNDDATSYNNCYTKHFKDHIACNNVNEVDVLVVGSFINTVYDYNRIKQSKCKKILCISEPLTEYMHQLIEEKEFIFIFGCINENSVNRYKFPLYASSFDYTDRIIFQNTNNFVKTCDIDSKQFCCLISRHDMYKSRNGIYQSLRKINHIVCPGPLFNNCPNTEVNKIGNKEYIKQFKFHICCESVLVPIEGYITEKLLNCCLGGAIPIYCGGYDDIDAKIFNKNRIIFFDYRSEHSIKMVTDRVNYLMNNTEILELFYRQDVFCDSAYDVIQDLEQKLVNGINQL